MADADLVRRRVGGLLGDRRPAQSGARRRGRGAGRAGGAVRLAHHTGGPVDGDVGHRRVARRGPVAAGQRLLPAHPGLLRPVRARCAVRGAGRGHRTGPWPRSALVRGRPGERLQRAGRGPSPVARGTAQWASGGRDAGVGRGTADTGAGAVAGRRRIRFRSRGRGRWGSGPRAGASGHRDVARDRMAARGSGGRGGPARVPAARSPSPGAARSPGFATPG